MDFLDPYDDYYESESDYFDSGDDEYSNFDFSFFGSSFLRRQSLSARRRRCAFDDDDDFEDEDNLLPALVTGSAPLTTIEELIDCIRDVRNLTEASTSDRNEGKSSAAQSGKVLSLLELSAKAVALTTPCQELENHDPPLDEALLKEVARWAFPEDLNRVFAVACLSQNRGEWLRGAMHVDKGCVREMWQVGFMATAYLHRYQQGRDSNFTSSSNIRVSLTFEKQRILASSCSECRNNVWCFHVIAAIIYRVKHPEKVRIHAPVTDTLSTLNRDQLQKLLQYAINDDPAGILGSVFKHVDAIRDASSEINITSGAPDPSFGGLNEGQKSQWQLTLDDFKQRFEDIISNQLAYKMYADSFDLEAKTNTRLFSFMQHVMRLCRHGDYYLAAQTIKTLVHSILSGAPTLGLSLPYNSALRRFVHDLDRLLALLIILTKDQDRTAHKELVDLAMEASSKCKELERMGQPLAWLAWAEMPSLQVVYKKEMRLVDRSKGFFLESVAAQFVPACPQELKDMLSGKVSVSESAYSEDWIVMLARMEVQFLLVKNTASFYRIADKVLRTLSEALLNESVLQHLWCSGAHRESIAHLFNLSEMCARTPSPSPEKYWKGASAKRRSSSRLGKQPAKKHRFSSVGAFQKHKPEAGRGYGLLYTLWLVLEGRKVLEGGCPWDATQLASVGLLALELSHYRMLNSWLPVSAQGWLMKLEGCVAKHLEKADSNHLAASGFYMLALTSDGKQFFESVYPLLLTETLTAFPSADQGRRMQNLQLCHAVLSSPMNTMQSYMGASKTGVSYDELATYTNYYMKKLSSVAGRFVSTISVESDEEAKLLLEVLEMFLTHEESFLLRLMEQSLRAHLTSLQAHPGVLDASFRLCIHYHNVLKKQVSTTMDLDLLSSIAGRLGPSCVRHLIGVWKNFLDCSQAATLLDVMQPSLIKMPQMPKEVSTMVMEVLDCPLRHTRQDVATLLSLFPAEDPSRAEAIRIITEAPSAHFSPAVYFLLLRDLYLKDQELPPSALPVVEKALNSISEQPISHYTNWWTELKADLEWLISVCITSGRGAGRLRGLVNVLCSCKHFRGKSEMLFALMEKMKSVQCRGDQLKNSTSDALLQALLHNYSGQLDRPSYVDYSMVISTMLQDFALCKGLGLGPVFVQKVVKDVMAAHGRKKKLIKMLRASFKV